jgi:hypothetical protein
VVEDDSNPLKFVRCPNKACAAALGGPIDAAIDDDERCMLDAASSDKERCHVEDGSTEWPLIPTIDGLGLKSPPPTELLLVPAVILEC